MSDVQIIYDAQQHCTARKESRGKLVSMDCPYTGKGEEFSPTNLVEAALGGCMLISMGTFAIRHDIDLTGTRIEVSISATDKPVMRFQAIDVQIGIPPTVAAADIPKLLRAAEGCPIKHSFGADIPITVEHRLLT